MTAKNSDPSPAAASKADAGDFETAFAALGKRADEARSRLAELPDEAARTAGKQLQKASKATQAKLRQLQKGWQTMEPKKRVQVIAGVLGAIAALTVPIVVAKKRKTKRAASGAAPAQPAKR